LVEALRNITTLKFNCFSYNINDVILLFFIYDLSFLLCITFDIGDIISSTEASILTLLIGLFIITSIDIFEKELRQEENLHEEEKELRKKIYDEYQKIHKVKRKQDLLSKIEGFHHNLASPQGNFPNNSGSTKTVHFNYLNKFNSTGLPNENPKSSPQGS